MNQEISPAPASSGSGVLGSCVSGSGSGSGGTGGGRQTQLLTDHEAGSGRVEHVQGRDRLGKQIVTVWACNPWTTVSGNLFDDALVGDRSDVWTDTQVTHEHAIHAAVDGRRRKERTSQDTEQNFPTKHTCS